jgi:hypothetical protein
VKKDRTKTRNRKPAIVPIAPPQPKTVRLIVTEVGTEFERPRVHTRAGYPDTVAGLTQAATLALKQDGLLVLANADGAAAVIIPRHAIANVRVELDG